MFWRKQAEVTPQSQDNREQLQSQLDGEIAREARQVCKVLSNPQQWNTPSSQALRAAVNGRHAEYLWSRFAEDFGWNSMSDAQRFYDANKGSKGGWYA